MPMPIVAGNWKMNTTLAEAVALATELRDALEAIRGVEKVVCPPFISLAAVKSILDGTSTRVGAQNMHYEQKGAYTGEVSPGMLAELCRYVILGHSERRQYFGETDELVNRKVKAALGVGLRPIVCVGERLEERETGRAEAVVTGQLRGALEGVPSADALVVAYEPVWAIGTGKAATGEIAEEVMGAIRRTLGELYGEAAAREVPLLYGGSVTPGNVAEFAGQPNVNGALVGGASLNAASFVEIARRVGEG
ncbi:MAG: triose-phosphate isomerase [Chloroflexi bacterium]|nr:triose-phosphate isomerase [Chloroflexota bacterium]